LTRADIAIVRDRGITTTPAWTAPPLPPPPRLDDDPGVHLGEVRHWPADSVNGYGHYEAFLAPLPPPPRFDEPTPESFARPALADVIAPGTVEEIQADSQVTATEIGELLARAPQPDIEPPELDLATDAELERREAEELDSDVEPPEGAAE